MTTSKKSLVYLTGFMGSGKTTLAPILANTLGFAHTDTDREVERIAGKTVSEVFRDHGEEYFREIEHRVLEQASKEHHRVV
ncbi:MAG TPA: shikimate kinase, partial [Bacteroidota bacterium]|nr:shikimate kinase [Bacteroidota bacterium]